MNVFEVRNRRPHTRQLVVALSMALGSAGLLTHQSDLRAAPSVTNCQDSGNGSLRASVAAAASGDTIDMTQLACGTITLTSGAIAVTQSSLKIQGPGENVLAIDGYFNDRVFRHTGAGVISLYDLTVQNGKYVSDTTPYGGCVYSNGQVALTGAAVTGCIVVGQGSSVARGGGVFAGDGMLMAYSTISDNTASGTGSPINNSIGGGANVNGDFIGKYSTIRDNRAITGDGHNSSGGGLETFGHFGIESSTISGNSAVAFGAVVIEGPNGAAAAIANSTISGNSADIFSGVYTQLPTTISNSTIVFNRARLGRGALYSQTAPIELESTIIAGNIKTSTASPDDVNGTDSTTLTGANNLIRSWTIPVPPDTITSCPRLGPLADNGGPTRTHRPRDDSPAIDNGNNDANLVDDQRGMPRVNGVAADIGSVEWYAAPEDDLFLSGFEPVCDQ